MNILISLALAFSLLGSATVERQKDTVVMDVDVIMSNKLPERGTICGDTGCAADPMRVFIVYCTSFPTEQASGCGTKASRRGNG